MTVEVSPTTDAAAAEQWRTYDDFAAGIDTYRLPDADLTGQRFSITLKDGPHLNLAFTSPTQVQWSGDERLATSNSADPYEAVQVRPDVLFVNLPFTSREREQLTLVISPKSGRVAAVHSVIQPKAEAGVPQVAQSFWSGTLSGVEISREEPGPSRYLIGHRNVYRYSPNHLYEHVYLSSERYAWQCIQGAQRGHGDVDMSTVWKFEEGLYIFCFREFKIAVASVWLHDLGYQLRTTGNFLGINAAGESEHSRAGGHIYPMGSVRYPDVQPI
jgi:hypothetical protein